MNKETKVMTEEEIKQAFNETFGQLKEEQMTEETFKQFASLFDETFGEAVAKTYIEEGENQHQQDEARAKEIGELYGEKFGELFGSSLGQTLGQQFGTLFGKRNATKKYED